MRVCLLHNQNNTFPWPIEHSAGPHDCDIFLTFDDYLTEQNRNIIASCRARGAKSVVFQHGRFSMEGYSDYGIKPAADYYLVWGPHSRDSMIRAGVSPERVIITGQPQCDSWQPISRGDTLKICFQMQHWHFDFTPHAQPIVGAIAGALEGNEKLIIKSIHGSEYTAPLPPRTEQVVSDPQASNHQSISRKVLYESHAVFCMRASTFELFARLAGCYSITVDTRDLDWDFPVIGSLTEVIKPFQNLIDRDEIAQTVEKLRAGTFEDKPWNRWNELGKSMSTNDIEDVFEYIATHP